MVFDRTAYMREYRQKNRDKIRAYYREYTREYTRNHPEKRKEWNKRYYDKDKEKSKERKRCYNRQHYLKIDGKYVRHDKGLRPKLCQLCNKFPARDYHHWKNGDAILGLWVCPYCHKLCEGVDKGLDIAYRALKEMLTQTKLTQEP